MNLILFLPELILILMILFFFVCSLFPKQHTKLDLIAVMFVIAAIGVTCFSFNLSGVLFSDFYRVDFFSQTFKLLILVAFLFVLLLSAGIKGIKKEIKAEYIMFLSISTFGLVCLTSAVELVTLILCIEISSFSLYIAIPFRSANASDRQHEAGLKYILFGALSTGVTLFGMSYIFGLCHTTKLSGLFAVLPSVLDSSPAGVVGFILLLGGFFFKLALFPLHFWTPDIYEGSANETTAYIATLPKIAGIAIIIRFMGISGVESGDIIIILAVLSILSMTIGNLSALVQEDIKRLVAYSTIAHAGYIMIGVLSAGSQGFSASIYYITGYVLMSIALFFVIYNLSEQGENLSVDSLNGLSKRSPFLAFTLAMAAFGMAGLPPTVGFTTKFMVFTSAIAKGYYFIVIIAVINAGISAFYYLRLVRAAYTMGNGNESSLKIGFFKGAFAVFVNIGIIFTGIYPEPLISKAVEAVKYIFS
ncbi:MAG: NADH-quinone oxidoreductase subunit N [Deltaproteobacteria bacterium]|nr:MAG: NADH-quinone oxidoreductase subunit N [Deltaproteobacteria bacterium]